MGRVFNNKIWAMDRYTLEYWQNSLRQWQDVKKSGILLEIEKPAEASGSDLTFCVFSLEDTVTHLPVTDPSKILTIEK